ncbi:hypothetical protein [Kitasatospora camelliae]|uniref:Uncharacterized protein n=1 Tax=Kitasatospora camelliae TaxID=3156397 RepID=A0AAU8JVA0_9ACTN
MGIGYLLLYAALAVVALWLLAELLLQSRAALLWRAVALIGFLCVVAGMRLASVLVIGAGAAAFAVGQTFVTLSVKRGRTVGWSLRKADGRLPGPLEKVPLLNAATDGTADDEEEFLPQVGEVGPIEAEEVPATSYEAVEELAQDGVYTEQPAPYYQQDQQQAVPQQPVYQQVAYDAYGQPVYQQVAYDAYGQPVYQDPYAQPQYQDPYAAQQAQQAQWAYQQQYQQQQDPYGYGQQQQPQQQSWGYQQQA